MRKIFLCLIFLLASCSILINSIKAQNRPNILILIADDMGTDAFEPYNIGADLPNTPFLSNLATQGVLFNNAWAYPTCAPSRASLMTGRYGNKNGITQSGPNLSNDETTLFEHLDTLTNNEYANAVFGKWHLGNANHPNNNGVQHYNGNLFSGVDDYFNWERTINGVTDTSTSYVTTYITDEAINWVDNQTKPWLLWMAYNAPHGPFHFPPDSLYTRTQTTNNFDRYICMIESVDHEAARLYNSFSQNQKDSTIVIFVGDNGTPNSKLQGYPSGHGKGSLYEGGIRVPMFVTGYGVERINEREEALVSFSDLFATLTELIGKDLHGGIENSFSFLPLLQDPNGASRSYNYAEQGISETEIERAIRNERFKLISRSDGSQEFYDLSVDSFEISPLVINELSIDQMLILQELQAESDSIFYSWSCNDDIQNGTEEDIDCGGSSCAPCVTTPITEILLDEGGISIFPNTFDHDIYLTLQSGNYSVKILDVNGSLYEQISFVGTNYTLEIDSLPQGLYFLEIVNTDNNKICFKNILKL